MSKNLLHNTLKVDKLLKQQIDALKKKSAFLKNKAQNLANINQRQNMDHKNIPNRRAHIHATHAPLANTHLKTHVPSPEPEPQPNIELIVTELQSNHSDIDVLSTTNISNEISSDNSNKTVEIHSSIYLDKNVIIM